jgi:hypothetical protein
MEVGKSCVSNKAVTEFKLLKKGAKGCRSRMLLEKSVMYM